jgi:hypothetical protein
MTTRLALSPVLAAGLLAGLSGRAAAFVARPIAAGGVVSLGHRRNRQRETFCSVRLPSLPAT